MNNSRWKEDTRINAFEFVNQQKEEFFRFLYDCNQKNFPRVCEFSADVLGCWLFAHYPQHTYDIIEGLYDGWSHCWVEVDGKIIDFTVTQFLGGMNQMEDENLTHEEFYKMYFEAYLPSPVIEGDLLINYKHEDYVFCVYIDLAKQCDDFESYLIEVRKHVEIQ